MTDKRLRQLADWASEQLAQPYQTPSMVSGDASFRRYFRLVKAATNETVILVDSPPDKEPIDTFLAITHQLQAIGLPVPNIIAHSQQQGLMMLEDFGDRLLLPALLDAQVRDDRKAAEVYYRRAFNWIIQLQANQVTRPTDLPLYDSDLLDREMMLFIDWFLVKHLNYPLSQEERKMLVNWFDKIRERILVQPQTYVHRDFHSRNLMILNAQNDLGIIDYQDACWGSYMYDLVSLLKDCYIYWPREQQLKFLNQYIALAKETNLAIPSNPDILSDFDLMGLQRHIKVAGIFCRLYHRDHKEGYLKDIPLVLGYIVQALNSFPEFKPIANWFKEQLAPHLAKHQMMWLELS